jgi:trans-2,3-dihydro-3-hydroxyanthranilate isomerase
MKREYHVVDVFTQSALEGNPLAVFPDASGLDPVIMQRIARELNLSETTFVFPADDPRAAARVRIFTPASEMEFAGHPTIGTAFVLRQRNAIAHDRRNFALEERVGLVRIRVGDESDPIIWLTTPPIALGGVYGKALCARALSLAVDEMIPDLSCELLTAGNPNIFVPLKSKEAVDRAVIDSHALGQLIRETPLACLFAFTPTPEGAYSRMFAPAIGVIEDPATGSATGPLAAYMMKHGLVSNGDGTRFISEQGTKMGRRSILHVLVHGENGARSIEVGGNVAPVAIGEFEIGADLGSTRSASRVSERTDLPEARYATPLYAERSIRD